MDWDKIERRRAQEKAEQRALSLKQHMLLPDGTALCGITGNDLEGIPVGDIDLAAPNRRCAKCDAALSRQVADWPEVKQAREEYQRADNRLHSEMSKARVERLAQLAQPRLSREG